MQLLFLPGAAGAAEFWHTLGDLLPGDWDKTYMSWPGLGNQPHDPAVRCFDDLVALAEKEIRGPTVLVAQSMGGIVAVRLALKHPAAITHLILVATSGGVDVAALGGEDWRASYLENFPHSARWITEEKPDHAHQLSDLACPALLIWGDCDPISPVAVGKHLLSLLPHAELQVVSGGDHGLAKDKAAEVAPLVRDFLQRQA